MAAPSTTFDATLATRRLIAAIAPQAGVAVAFHLPTVRTVADDDLVRGMYFLDDDVDLDPIEAIAMAPGGAAMLLKDGSVRLPPVCPRAQSPGPTLLESHADELRHLEPLGRLCIGVGRLPGLPPVALALDFQHGLARGAAVLRSKPHGAGLDLLPAIGVRVLSTTPLPDGRVRVDLESRLEAHLDAVRLSGYRRTQNCNRFLLSHGEVDGDIERGLIETARVRIDAGRERLAEAAITLAHRALDEGLALHRCGPRDPETTPCGDLAPLGLLGAALETVRTTSSSNAAAAGAALERLRAHLESHRRDGLWSSARGCIPTSTNTALVALAGLAPDHSTLETLRGPSGGLVPQAVADDDGGDATRRSRATELWEQEDVPTTALVEASRMDAGLDPVVDAAWFLKRFRKWGGLSFTPSTMGLWAIARFAARLGARAADVESDDAAPSGERTRDLRATLIRMVQSDRRAPGHASEIDPVLHESLGILTLSELDAAHRFALAAQVRLLDAWERDDSVETPFHSTLVRTKPRTFEEVMAIQADPSTAFLHGTPHEVTVYEDPHRLVGTALACLALHVDASDNRSISTDYRVDRRSGASVREQAFLHVEPYMAPARSLGEDRSDPFVTPRDRVPLVEAMNDALDRLGPDLISEAARIRVSDSVARTDPDHVKGATFGLELRFAPDDDTVDFLWCLSRKSRNLAALLSTPDRHSRFRHLARLWATPSGAMRPPIAHIENVWFEQDLDADGVDAPPAFFFGPSDLETKDGAVYGPHAVASNIQRIIDAFDLPPSTREDLDATIDRIDRLDTDAAIFQTGLMFSRRSNPVRLCFAPIDDRERLIEVLRGVGLKDRLATLTRIVERIPEGKIAPCIDVAPDGIRTRVGFECYSGTSPRRTRSFPRLVLDAFRDTGRVSSTKASAFLDAEGWAELGAHGGLHRSINHIKILMHPDESIEVKGYLALSRRAAPSFHDLVSEEPPS